MSEPTYSVTRFACRCGRFLPESAIRYATFRDDSRYYGIRDEVEWDCTRCGTVKGEEWEPSIVVVATHIDKIDVEVKRRHCSTCRCAACP